MGNKDIALISRQSWLNFFRDMQQIKNPQTGEPILEQANRALQVCDRIYRFAVSESIAGVTGNPLDHLHERMEKHESQVMAHVSESDLPALLNAIATIPSDITRLGVQLLSHLFLRPNEVLDGKWCEIDFDNRLWEIPKERMKKRRPHTVPLSEQVIAMLTELKAITGNDEMLFPTRSMNPTDRHARFRQALKRKGYDGKQTLHGFRHIASTKLNNYTDDSGKKSFYYGVSSGLLFMHREAPVDNEYDVDYMMDWFYLKDKFSSDAAYYDEINRFTRAGGGK